VTHVILQLFPELTNVNGDAENAAVLARRAAWLGLDAEVLPLAAGDPAPGTRPVAMVLGSGVDSNLRRTRDSLELIREALTEWIGHGVPVLAVGTGMELLGGEIPLADGIVEGLGILPGTATPLPQRVAGDLVVESTWGTLVGYENHARGYSADGATTLGAVLHGTGNGKGTEGVVQGSVFGTRLHGPVLARNPSFAMALLAAAFGEKEDVYHRGPADGIADAINSEVLRRVKGH
jgi:CobQ-like glutamine amidotransferase family enzyme